MVKQSKILIYILLILIFSSCKKETKIKNVTAYGRLGFNPKIGWYSGGYFLDNSDSVVFYTPDSLPEHYSYYKAKALINKKIINCKLCKEDSVAKDIIYFFKKVYKSEKYRGGFWNKFNEKDTSCYSTSEIITIPYIFDYIYIEKKLDNEKYSLYSILVFYKDETGSYWPYGEPVNKDLHGPNLNVLLYYKPKKCWSYIGKQIFNQKTMIKGIYEIYKEEKKDTNKQIQFTWYKKFSKNYTTAKNEIFQNNSLYKNKYIENTKNENLKSICFCEDTLE